ncbi:MAG: ATP-binding protein [Gemmatimonadota bacterium]|nr:ATP-binding protein [Gemmatimonadota bacterium]
MDFPNPKAPTIRKFNPGTFQADEEVIRQFVVREHELNTVLDVLRGNVDSESCQHILVVAPRGRGKTMLLARVAAELRIGGDLSQRLLPVRFMEESQEVLDIADFWLETLFHLSREITGRDPDLSKELRAVHADLATRWRSEFLAERARAAVLDASDRLDRKLVLMVENLQALCTDVDEDFGWQLRETLQTEPQIILLGTATSRFKRLDDVQEPFFGFFRTINLEPLDTEACRRLLHVISDGEVTKRNISPLAILTGGSPRLLVILAEFARYHTYRKLMEELVKLVDDHTEYFRGQLEALPPTERRVYLAVLDLWRPSRTSEIAVRARMDVRSVSSLLGRLINRGAVIFQGKGRKRAYTAAEPLYSIYYKLRRERDEAAEVRNIIRFMAMFYSQDENAEVPDELTDEPALMTADRDGLERTMSESLVFDCFLDDVNTTDEDSTLDDNVLDDGKSVAPEVQIADAMMHAGIVQFRTGDHKAAITTCNSVIDRFAKTSHTQMQVAIATGVKGAVLLKYRDFEAALDAFNELIKRNEDRAEPEFKILVSNAFILKTIAHSQHSELDQTVAIYDKMIRRPGVTSLPAFPIVRDLVMSKMIKKGLTHFRVKGLSASIAALDGFIQRFGEFDEPEIRIQVATAMFLRAFTCLKKRESLLAIAAFDSLIERFGNDNASNLQNLVVRAMGFKAETQVKTGHAEDALQTCDEVEKRLGSLPGNSAYAPRWLTTLAKGMPGRVLKVDSELSTIGWQLKWLRVIALLIQEKHQAAMDELRSVYAKFDPENEVMMHSILHNLIKIVGSGAQVREIIEILESDKKKAEVVNPLIVALYKRLGEKVRAPTEVLEVADDIVAEMNKRRQESVAVF